jgi:hypothetical protein
MKIKSLRNRTSLLFLLAALAWGCGSVQTVKGDLIKVDRRTIGPDVEGYRLEGVEDGWAVLRKTSLCPVQERRTYREVEVRTEAGGLSAAQGVGCGLTKFAEIGHIFTGGPGDQKVSNCMAHSITDRRPTGRTIPGPWRTLRRKKCGGSGPAPPGGKVFIRFIRTGRSKEYPIGAGGTIRFGGEDLARLRIFFTILRDMKIEARYRGASWLQKLTLE